MVNVNGVVVFLILVVVAVVVAIIGAVLEFCVRRSAENCCGTKKEENAPVLSDNTSYV